VDEVVSLSECQERDIVLVGEEGLLGQVSAGAGHLEQLHHSL
jgi:hypothetical protein